MDLNVIPECYLDTKLIKVAVPPKGRYNHQKGCPNVIKVMREKLPGDFALGIIDRDKKILAYTGQFDLVYELPDALQLLKHPTRHHYLIFVLPAVEKWLLLGAEEVDLKLTDLGLPHDLGKLCDITKTSKSENDDPYSDHLTKLFRELKRRKSVRMQVLSFWITYLKENPYTADMAQLVAETNVLAGF
ncbi:MAG: hypothetical protein H7Z72_21270 [Bacteroidetes bacterium]|nr:hypothetical protein [Fibrella sp.]